MRQSYKDLLPPGVRRRYRPWRKSPPEVQVEDFVRAWEHLGRPVIDLAMNEHGRVYRRCVDVALLMRARPNWGKDMLADQRYVAWWLSTEHRKEDCPRCQDEATAVPVADTAAEAATAAGEEAGGHLTR
jgi:hypothetical protein